MKKQILSILLLFYFSMAVAQCPEPFNIQVQNVGETNATLWWEDITALGSGPAFYELYYGNGNPAPTENTLPHYQVGGNAFDLTNLDCDTGYLFWIRTVCYESETKSAWVPFQFYTYPCINIGQPQNLAQCREGSEACFDLHQNDTAVLNGNSPDEYAIRYYANIDDAGNFANEVTSAFCVSSGSHELYAALYHLFTGEFAVAPFTVTVLEDVCAGIRLNAFVDANNNGVQDNGEVNFAHVQFQYEANGDNNVHVVSGVNGSYQINDTNAANSYDVGLIIDPEFMPYFNAPVFSYLNVHPQANGFSSYNFPLHVTAPYHDVSVSMFSWGSPRAGWPYYYQHVTYKNNGNFTESGTISFIKPTELPMDFVSAPPGTDLVTTNATGFTSTFVDLMPGQSRSILVKYHVPPIPLVNFGQHVTANASVSITGDAVASNNQTQFVETITGSYDPNDKIEIHGPEIPISAFTAADELTYTIRFENTGNTEALNIKITDVLDDQLDASTVRMVSSSHDVLMDRVGANITWRFNNIHLPPFSETDPEQGHGYLTFAVKPVTFAIDEVIPNTASIYFDFNPAIVTNTFETHFVETLGTKTESKCAFKMHPNPAHDKVTIVSSAANVASVAIFDLSGKQVQSVRFENAASAVLNLNGLQSGMYFVKVTTESGLTSTQKLIKN